jgi:hypothetical protein
MRKTLLICLLTLIIAGSALWGAQHVRFFEKLPMFVNDLSGTLDDQMGWGGMHRQRGGEQSLAQSLARWGNVLAYVSIFAFFVMMTYYAELGLCKVRSKAKVIETRKPETVLSTS